MRARIALAIAAGLSVTACGNLTPAENLTYGVIGTTILGSASPSAQLEQFYYLGVVDPLEQLPPTVYRIRVRGQGSILSFTKFASGWLPAKLIDTFGASALAEDNFKVKQAQDPDQLAELETGRRLMLFGPEGFREAPRDHRLVIGMGSNPQAFFDAVDQSLAVVSQVRFAQRTAKLEKQIFEARERINDERVETGRILRSALQAQAAP